MHPKPRYPSECCIQAAMTAAFLHHPDISRLILYVFLMFSFRYLSDRGDAVAKAAKSPHVVRATLVCLLKSEACVYSGLAQNLFFEDFSLAIVV